MKNNFFEILIVLPVTLFFSGFLLARQLRTVANAPLISKVFVERKLLFAVVISLFLSLLFTLITSFGSMFSTVLLLRFLELFFLGTVSFYLGVTLGFGRHALTDEFIIPTVKVEVYKLPENIIFEESQSSIKIAVNAPKRWGMFLMSAIQFAILGLCGLPFFALVAVSTVQKYVPQNTSFIIWIFVGGLVLYLLYIKFQEVLEYIFEKEIIEVSNSTVRIEQSGSGFKSRKEFPADNIRQITTLFPLGGIPIRRSPFLNKNFSAFLLQHNRGLKRYHSFGRGIDLADAQRILGLIYTKFPHYKGQ